jgi:hypothetical protein
MLGKTKNRLLLVCGLAVIGACVFATTALAGPSNDAFSNAQTITGVNGVANGNNTGASRESGEPLITGNMGGASIWYSWTAPSTGFVTISTFGTGFDTLLGIYTGSSVNNLTLVTANDDNGGGGNGTWSSLNFTASGGTTYRIAVDGYNGGGGAQQGPITLNWNLNPSSPSPSNDNFSNAITINGNCTTVTGTNVGASKEEGEPNHAGNVGGASVWWKWIAPISGSATVTTDGSDFDTLLGVYTGSSVSSLTEVASNDDDSTGSQSSLTFNAVQGTTYYIAVDGYFGPSHGLHTGHITLNVCQPLPSCKQKMNVQWHYRSHGTSGSWSATVTPNCQTGSISIGPSTMEGDLKVNPGQAVDFGYRFNVSAPAKVTVMNAQVKFTIRCVNGSTPSQSSYTTAMLPTTTYNVTKSGWNPSNDQQSPLVWQGTFNMPNFCNGGQVRLDKGGTFTANMLVQ